MTPIVPTTEIELVWQGVDHPEGLAIDLDGVVWCGGEEGQIYRGPLRGEPEHVANVPGRPLGFALDGVGNAYCCAYLGDVGLYRISASGEVAAISFGSKDRRSVVPNHPAFLVSGVLLFTDSGEWGEDAGCIFAVDTNGRTTVADTSCSAFPNGLAVSPDGRSLAVVESTLPGISVLSISSGGELIDRRVLIEMDGVIPDGIAYDREGRLLISCWTPDVIYILDEGRLTTLASDETRFVLNQPTNIAFVPGERLLAAANIGERFLSLIPHKCLGYDLVRPA